MKQIKIFCFLLLLITGFSTSATAQDIDGTNAFNPLLDDITQRIPSLQDLIDSALIHSPLLMEAQALIDQNRYKVITQKREWLRNFYIDLNVSNFYYDGLTSNQTNLGDINRVLTNQNINNALAGLSIRLPMDYLYDRGNRIKTAKKEVEKSLAARENQKLELRKSIILQYNQLIITQKVLKIANDNQISMQLQKDMGEKEFLNGQMTLYELASISEMNRRAVTDFEQARIEFYNAYMILQEIVGIRFNVINKIE
jgi:outer membrane protein TolC